MLFWKVLIIFLPFVNLECRARLATDYRIMYRFPIFAVVLHEWKLIIWVSQRLILVGDLSIGRTQECLHLYGPLMTRGIELWHRQWQDSGTCSWPPGHPPAGQPGRAQHPVCAHHISCPPQFSRPAERVWTVLSSSTPPPSVPQTPSSTHRWLAHMFGLHTRWFLGYCGC